MKKIIPFTIGIILGICLILLVEYLFLKDRITMPSENEDPTEQVQNKNTSAKIIELSSEDFLKIKDTISKTTVVNFWASWCKPCIEEMPILIDYTKKNKINLLLISVDRNNDKQKNILLNQMKKLNIGFCYIIKNQSSTDLTNRNAMVSFAEEAKLNFKNNSGIPYFVVLNKNGNVTSEFNGFNKEEAYDNFFDKMILK